MPVPGRGIFVLKALFILCAVSIAQAQETGEKVGKITIQRVNVFDPTLPQEDHPPYTWVNKLHIVTREKVVRRELLLQPGDNYDPYLKEQTERNLRAFPFIKDARIIEDRGKDGAVNLYVRTQDAWTTDVAPSYGSSGGKSSWGMLLREKNLLGRGRTLELSYDDEFNEVGRTIAFKDPRVAGTRWALRLINTDYSEGFDGRAKLELPLYSLLTPYYMGISFQHSSYLHRLYQDGKEFKLLRKNGRYKEAYAGRSLIATSRHAFRAALGVRGEEEKFSSTQTVTVVDLPMNQKRGQMVVRLNYEQSDFVKEAFINQFERYEDFNLGWESGLEVRRSLIAMGSDRSEWIPSAFLSRGLRFGQGHFATFSADASFIYSSLGYTQILKALNANYYLRNFFHEDVTFVAHAETAEGLRLQKDSQLLLGGNRGLRGYRLNAFTGVRSMLFNAETRWHAATDVLRIFSLAPTLFWDAGYVWPKGERPRLDELKHDVGMGLRVGFTRSASYPVLRMDAAYALNSEGAARKRWIFSVSTSIAFGAYSNALKTEWSMKEAAIDN